MYSMIRSRPIFMEGIDSLSQDTPFVPAALELLRDASELGAFVLLCSKFSFSLAMEDLEVLLFHLQNGSSQRSVLHYDLFLEARSSAPFLIQLNEKSRRVLFSICFAAYLLTWQSERCLDEQKRSFSLE